MSLLSPPLQAFQAIVKHKTVHAAAHVLYITQTAVTQRIRTLEQKLQVTLFIRTRRGMLLTPEGEALQRYCQAVREIEGEALGQIKNAGVEKEIQICITGSTSIMRSRIIPACIPAIKQFPYMQLQFDINDIENRVKSLRTGESQFAIIQQHDIPPEMRSKQLNPEQYVLVCTPKWKRRKLLDIISNERIVDFDPTDQLTFNYLKKYHLSNQARHDRHFANRTESLALMIMEGLGYGLLTKEFSEPYINSKKMMLLNDGKIYENAIALVWYDRPEPPRYFSALIEIIK